MVVKSLTEQIEAMERCWPRFQVTENGDRLVVWHGELAPLDRHYHVVVAYGLPRRPSVKTSVREAIYGIPKSEWCRIFPIVRILSPTLELRHDAIEEAPLPHVYPDRQMPHLSPLCLFDPSLGEWSRDDLIGETTIFWTADWLACYEAWLATGRWPGRSRPATTVLYRLDRG